MIPISPKMPVIREAMHQRKMVRTEMEMMNHCTPENLLSMVLMGTRWVFLELQLNVINKKIQMSNNDKTQTGNAMTNHWPHEGCGSMAPMAIMFWGEAIGEAIPPTLDARAIPKIRALMNWEPLGNVLNNGWISEKQSTGAATFETHMEANKATPMIVSKTTEGLVPALDKIHVDINLAMWYFDNAAANVKPPNNNNMTEFHIVDNINFEESTESMSEPSSFFNTPRLTINKGINKEVTKRGMASVAHKREEQINNAKQFFWALSAKGEKFNNTIVTVAIKTNLIKTGFLSEILNLWISCPSS